MDRRPIQAVAALAALTLAGGCGPSEGAGKRPPAVRRLRDALVPSPRFRAPADGLLTDEQVERFVRVRRAAKGRTDAETARALGVSPDEVSWARARIIEALVALDERRVREASAETYAKALAELRAARASTKNPADARTLDEQIAALERERGVVRREETPAPTLARNIRIVASHRAELEAVAP